MKPYDTEFDAVVIDCTALDQNGTTVYQVVLDQTLFFPEEGGQSPDKGTINGIPVLDVQIKKDVITHTLASALESGAAVHGSLDWNHRFSNMQQHSGEHIFSGLVHARFGYDNVGFHLSDQVVTMDFNGTISASDLADIEGKANQIIVQNLPIEITFPSKEELRSLDYRSKIEIDGQVRIVTIPGVDVCACCAPHVKLTGEIGMLKVMNCQSYKGGVRISILCGFRALTAFCEKNAVLSQLTAQLSSSQEGLPVAVKRLQDTVQALKAQLSNFQQEQLAATLASISSDQKDVILFESSLDTPVVRNAVNDLVAAHDGICGIFVGDDENGYTFILGSRTVDCKEIAALLRQECQAKGGGSNIMIQGSVAASQEKLQTLLIH